VIVLDFFFEENTRQELSLGVKMMREIPSLRGMFPRIFYYYIGNNRNGMENGRKILSERKIKMIEHIFNRIIGIPY
jgi:hypothetical protein